MAKVLGGGPDSVYVRAQQHNESVFTYLQGSRFDCRKKSGVLVRKY